MLIWASEESGYRHLYLFLTQLSPPTSTEDQPSHEDQGIAFKCWFVTEIKDYCVFECVDALGRLNTSLHRSFVAIQYLVVYTFSQS